MVLTKIGDRVAMKIFKDCDAFRPALLLNERFFLSKPYVQYVHMYDGAIMVGV